MDWAVGDIEVVASAAEMRVVVNWVEVAPVVVATGAVVRGAVA